jgi:hypothetical protein
MNDEIAWKIYLKIRPRERDEESALQAVYNVLLSKRDRLPPNAPPADMFLLRTLARDQVWEARYQKRATAPSVLQTVDDDAEGRLQSAIKVAHTMQAILEHASNVLNDASDAEDALDRPSKDDVSALRNIQLTYLSALQTVRECEEDVQKRRLEKFETSESKIQEITTRLAEQYDGMGPQYELLCRRLAEITAHIDAVRESGRQLSPSELKSLYDLHTTLVNQLQKHTESTKSESVSKEAAEHINTAIKIFEDIIAPEQPQLWLKAVNAVRARINSGAA